MATIGHASKSVIFYRHFLNKPNVVFEIEHCSTRMQKAQSLLTKTPITSSQKVSNKMHEVHAQELCYA